MPKHGSLIHPSSSYGACCLQKMGLNTYIAVASNKCFNGRCGKNIMTSEHSSLVKSVAWT